MEWHDWPNLDHKPTIVDRMVQKSHLTTRNRRGVVSFKRGTWGTNLFCSSQVMLFHFFHSPFLLSSVQFSLSATSDSLWHHGLQHARLPCLSPTPGACSYSFPSSQWCHPTISSSVIHLSSCLQNTLTSGSFQWVSSSHQMAKVLELLSIV